MLGFPLAKVGVEGSNPFVRSSFSLQNQSRLPLREKAATIASPTQTWCVRVHAGHHRRGKVEAW